MELADMQDLGSCAQALGFKSPYPHQIISIVLIPLRLKLSRFAFIIEIAFNAGLEGCICFRNIFVRVHYAQ